jgi:hypothetical protein
MTLTGGSDSFAANSPSPPRTTSRARDSSITARTAT